MKKNKSINKCLLAFPRCQCESAYVRARVAVQGFRKAPHNTKPSERATRTVSQSICAFPPFPHSVHIRGKVCTEAKPKVNRGRFGRCVIAAGANDTTIVSEGEKEVRMWHANAWARCTEPTGPLKERSACQIPVWVLSFLPAHDDRPWMRETWPIIIRARTGGKALVGRREESTHKIQGWAF